jgi:hypothetical protein
MKVEVALPPNFGQIIKAFPDAKQLGVIFAYGDTIYNPSDLFLPTAILAHEGVHGERQQKLVYVGAEGPSGPEVWWTRYINDAEFRYREELAAHVAEFRDILSTAGRHYSQDRNRRAQLLMSTARRLIAPLYEYPKDFTLRRAMDDIEQEYQK